jgi:hypothetical protein
VDSTAQVLFDIYNFCCPLEKIFVCPQRMSTPYLKNLRRLKEVCSKAHLSGRVKYLNIEIKNEINRINSIFVGEIFSSNKPGDIWKGIKRLTGDFKNCRIPIVNVDEMNSGFVFQTERNNSVFESNIESTSNFTPVSVPTISRLLSNLKPKCSSGPDCLPPFLLKHCCMNLAPVICDIVNQSLSSGILPESWRNVKITPIPKTNSSPNIQTKFRPIANTSVLLKIAEHCVLNELQSALSVSADPLQFAYKRKRSTVDAIATLMHKVIKALDSGEKVYKCIFLDYSSAFNTIPRELLISNLETKGVAGWLTKWIANYFSNRTQFVQIGGKSSASIPNNCGVLQGAVLSPFIFASHLDSLMSDNVLLLKYADDLTVGSPAKSDEQCRILSDEMQVIFTWSKENGLLLNKSKCVEILFHFRNCRGYELTAGHMQQIQYEEEAFQRVKFSKYLGVMISEDFSWAIHMDSLFKKCRRLSYYVKRLRSYRVPSSTIWKFVDSCILPNILYCSPVIYPGLLKKDFVVFKRLIKLVSTVSLFPFDKLCDIIIKRHFSASSNLANNILNDMNHPLFESLNNCRCIRSLRATFTHQACRTTTYKNSVIPFLSRFLSNPSREIALFTDNLKT